MHKLLNLNLRIEFDSTTYMVSKMMGVGSCLRYFLKTRPTYIILINIFNLFKIFR